MIIRVQNADIILNPRRKNKVSHTTENDIKVIHDVHTQEENARLMSAAPELLEACIKAYEALDSILAFKERGLMVQGLNISGGLEPFDNFINENMEGNELELLYKAIQKARGGIHEKS